MCPKVDGVLRIQVGPVLILDPSDLPTRNGKYLVRKDVIVSKATNSSNFLYGSASRDLRFSAMLRCVYWELVTDVSVTSSRIQQPPKKQDFMYTAAEAKNRDQGPS